MKRIPWWVKFLRNLASAQMDSSIFVQFLMWPNVNRQCGRGENRHVMCDAGRPESPGADLRLFLPRSAELASLLLAANLAVAPDAVERHLHVGQGSPIEVFISSGLGDQGYGPTKLVALSAIVFGLDDHPALIQR